MADAIFHDVKQKYGPIGRVLDLLTRAFAIGGGITLTAMSFMSVGSVAGRALFSKPILGDYELVQVMSAVAVAMSLPFCQMIRGHVIVDFFTMRAPKSVNRGLDLIANLLLAIAGFVIAWRLGLGMLELRGNGDASMLLNFPTWIGYAPMVPSFFLLGCAALYSAYEDFTGARP